MSASQIHSRKAIPTVLWPAKKTDQWIDSQTTLGRQLYTEGKYQEALEIYAQLLMVVGDTYRRRKLPSTPLLLDLLDARAATLEKVRDYEHAIKTAMQMVKTFPRDPKGYLRKARSEILTFDYSAAEATYKIGVWQASRANPKHQTLRKALSIHEGKMKKFFRDPTTIPIELQHRIFGYLSYRSLLINTRVSRRWCRSIRSTLLIQTSIDTFCSNEGPDEKQLQALFENITRLTSVTMRHHLGNKSSAYRYLLGRIASSGTLEELIIQRQPLLMAWAWSEQSKPTPLSDLCSYISNGSTPSTSMVRDIDGNCSNWTTNLKVIRDHLSFMYPATLQKILIRCTKLEEIVIHNLAQEGQEQLNWDVENMPEIPLKVFRVLEGEHNGSTPRVLWDDTLTIVEYLLSKTKSTLQELSLGEFVASSPLDLSPLSELQYLKLVGTTFEDSLPILPSSLQTLVLYRILLMRNTDTSSLETASFPELKILDLAQPKTESNPAQRPDNHRAEVQLWKRIALTSKTEGPKVLRLFPFDSAANVRDLFATDILRHVVRLKICLCFDHADELVDELLAAATALKRLDVRGSKITGYFVKRFVTRSTSSLEHLGLDACHDISDDAFDWLRSRGVSFSAEMSDRGGAVGGGAAVRYWD